MGLFTVSIIINHHSYTKPYPKEEYLLNAMMILYIIIRHDNSIIIVHTHSQKK